jgi:hypothetical protein
VLAVEHEPPDSADGEDDDERHREHGAPHLR